MEKNFDNSPLFDDVISQIKFLQNLEQQEFIDISNILFQVISISYDSLNNQKCLTVFPFNLNIYLANYWVITPYSLCH